MTVMDALVELIPLSPVLETELDADGHASLVIGEERFEITRATIAEARREVLDQVAAYARSELGRPVRLLTRDPSGSWELAVHPDGHVVELASLADKPVPRSRRRAALGLIAGACCLLGAGVIWLAVASSNDHPAKPTSRTTPPAAPSQSALVNATNTTPRARSSEAHTRAAASKRHTNHKVHRTTPRKRSTSTTTTVSAADSQPQATKPRPVQIAPAATTRTHPSAHSSTGDAHSACADFLC